MKQNNEIRFKTTTEIKEKIQKKAQAGGMTIKGYLIYLALNTDLKISIN